jgi:hypothetical protein
LRSYSRFDVTYTHDCRLIAGKKMRDGQNHEPPTRAHDIKIGSDQSFGLVFAIVFGLIGLWPAIRIGWRPSFDFNLLRLWSIVIAALLLAFTLANPAALHPFNRLWFRFGVLLSRVATPVVMALVFTMTVIPTAMIMRVRRRDLLGLKFDRQAKSYWLMRDPPGPSPESMKKQY